MPHIHTKPGQHDHTASAYVIRTDFTEPKLLLHYHKKLGTWLQFGGHIELHETPWQAVIHELREESGYALQQLQLLQPHDRLQTLTGAVLHPTPFSHITVPFDDTHMHTDVAYIFITDTPPAHALAAHESTQFKLLTLDEIHKLPAGDIFQNVREAAVFALEHCLPNWQRLDPHSFD